MDSIEVSLFLGDETMGNNLELSHKESAGPLYRNFKCLLLKNCSLDSFKFIAFATDAYRCCHINFPSNWMSFRVIKILH